VTVGEIGRAAVPPASQPLAAMAATANAGALRAMVNRNVDVRFCNRERYKVNFRSGTSSVCSTTTRHLPDLDRFTLAGDQPPDGPGSCVLAASRVQGDCAVTIRNSPRTRGALYSYDARSPSVRQAESPRKSYEMNHSRTSTVLRHSSVTAALGAGKVPPRCRPRAPAVIAVSTPRAPERRRQPSPRSGSPAARARQRTAAGQMRRRLV
jgi:hypothetical protein